MEYSRLYFWKDLKACMKYYKDKEGKSEEDLEHKVKLAMIFGSVVTFRKEADLKSFEGSAGVRTYDKAGVA